jgi:two-component system, LytTR family, sensor kinase
MKFPYPPQYQLTGFWLSMPVISFIFCYILFDERVFTDMDVWFIAFPLIILMGYMSFRLHHVYDHWLKSKFPSLDQTRKRVMYKIPVNIFIMTPSVLVIIYIFHFLSILKYQVDGNDIFMALLLGLGVNIIFESLWEVIYIIEKYKESVAEEAMIEQLRLGQEFNKLKQIVNPHFLFNCFNTLSSLIYEDKVQAEKFLDELSKVYRYLLRNNENDMSTVAQEVQFMVSYARLLETRYGDAFRMEMNINPKCMECDMPSLTLQLLVENAVKHNVVSRSQPIVVTISSVDEGYLVIENNLNRKKRLLNESNGIGLSNIRDRYRLLNRQDVSVEESEDIFRVRVPYISCQTACR